MRTRKHLMNGVKVSLVNGRDLHRFVASGKAYRTWGQIHLERGELVRDKDYLIVVPKAGDALYGTMQPEFWFTFQAAAYIGVMTRGKHGAALRQYCVLRNQLQALSKVAPTTEGNTDAPPAPDAAQVVATQEVFTAVPVETASQEPGHPATDTRLLEAMMATCTQLADLVRRMEVVERSLATARFSRVRESAYPLVASASNDL